MKKWRRTAISFLLLLTMIFSTSASTVVFAETEKFDNKELKQEEIKPKRLDGHYSYELTGKGRNTEVYGNWKEMCRKYTDGTSNGTISGSLSVTVSHSYQGSLQVPIKDLTAYLGLAHTIGVSWTKTVSDSEPLKGLPKGTYAIKWRKVYNSQPVTQTKYYHIDGFKRKIEDTTITVKKFKSISFKLEKISNSDIS